MNIFIQSKGGTPIYEQIATQIKEAILAGKLNKDDALPSIRALSADIKVSVITTKKAYEELEKEKMIYSVPGKGFFVDDADNIAVRFGMKRTHVNVILSRTRQKLKNHLRQEGYDL